MKILVTGGTGFVGSHMIDYLLKNVKDVKIFATRRWRSRDDNIKHLYSNSQVKFIEADLTDRGSLYKAIRRSCPDIVYHFAAQSFPETSFLTPVMTLNTNTIGTTNLMEELKNTRDEGLIDPIIVSVSSSEVYGNPTKDEVPITEKNMIRAANPYSISKVGHDLMSQYYYSAYDLKVIITRMFSHEGARRGKQFALSSFAYQIVQHEKSSKFFEYKHKSKPLPQTRFVIEHGNLNSVRTYNHIEDAVEAYWLCSTATKFGEIYNIGGDYTCTVGDALDMLISKSKSPKSFVKKLNKDRVRPTDITLQIPDSSKFRNEFGWKPKKDLTHICDDLLNYWRGVL